jgi:hypothetical protein
VTTSPTLLLSPAPIGCGWLPDTRKSLTPHCPQPPAYELTCSFTGMTSRACIEHTAAMRALHPDWIAQITSATNTPSSTSESVNP